MGSPGGQSSERERRVDEAVAAYYEALEAGQPLSPDEFLARYPDLAEELTSFLDARAAFAGRAGPAPAPMPAHAVPTLAPGEAPAYSGPLLGTVRYFGDYELIEELARGGMGVVYKARQVSLNRIVALKMILAGQLASAADVARFRAEAEAAGNLDHPHIVPIYEVGEHQGQHYFAMKLIEGANLGALTREVPTTDAAQRRAARLLAAVARAVHYAHQRGILHRDLKPANVLLDAEQHPFVTDFGLAKRTASPGRQPGEDPQTQTGAVVGTPSYMAPEQAAGKKGLTTAADVYSLGAILYELLTGKPPFRGDTALDTLLQVLEREPEPPRRLNPQVDRDLEVICLKCLHKEPPKRYGSAEALAEELERWLAGAPIRARPVGRLEKARMWVRRNPLVAGLLAAVAVALVAGSAVSTYFAIDAAGQAADAEAKAKAARESAADAKAKEKIARDNAAETRRVLAEFSVAHGVRLEEQGDLLGALPWYAEPLRHNPDDAAAAATVRLRLTAYRCYANLPTLVQVLSHGDGLRHAAFSPDGRWVVTAGEGKLARVWDAATGKPVTPPLAHQGPVNQVGFSPDGGRVLTVSGDTVRVWDAATGRSIWSAQAHLGVVGCAAFSPDGRRVFSAGVDRVAGVDPTVRVWDAATSRPVTPPLKHQADLRRVGFSPSGDRFLTFIGNEAQVWDAATGRAVTPPLDHQDPDRLGYLPCAAFGPDGRRVVTASTDGTARVWDAATGKQVAPALTHQEAVVFAALSPDGRRVLTVSGYAARVWDATTGRPVTPPLAHQKEVTRAAFSPDGRRVLTFSEDRTARVWDAATGKPVTPPLAHPGAVTHAAFSPDGRRVLTASEDGAARIWDLASPPFATPPLAHQDQVFHAAFSPDGWWVVTASGDGTARVWDTASGRPLTPPLAHQNEVYHAAFSPDGQWVVTASRDGTALVWDATSGKPVTPPLAHQGMVNRVAFSPDGRRVLTVSLNGTARVWDAATGQPITPPLANHLQGAAFSPDGRRVLTASGGEMAQSGTAQIWDAATGRALVPPLRHQGAVWHAAFSPDGRRVVTASADQTARVWDAATGQPVTPPLAHPGAMRHAAFSPDGRLVLITSGNTARVWDASTGQPVTPPLAHQGEVWHAAFSPDGQRVVTASADRTARVWDAATGKPVTPPLIHPAGRRAHQVGVMRAAFSPDGRRVLTVGRDGTARVWDAATGRPLTPRLEHQDGLRHAAFSPDGRRVLTASEDGTARVWDLTSDDRPAEDWLALAQVLSGRRIDASGVLVPLTAEELTAALDRLRPRYPREFTVSVEQVIAWHRGEMEACDRERNPAAALFHAWHAAPEWHALWGARRP
jgi:WD40 repeat protein/tRNA A-37 threonylcarbamoyl transferase component Bud32